MVIIDAATPNYHQLLQDVIQNQVGPGRWTGLSAASTPAGPSGATGRQFEALLIDSNVDGVAALGQILAQYRGLDAVHVISHGARDGFNWATRCCRRRIWAEYSRLDPGLGRIVKSGCGYPVVRLQLGGRRQGNATGQWTHG